MANKENKKQKIFKVSEFINLLNTFLVSYKTIVQGEIGAKISKYPRFTFFDLLDKEEQAILPCFIWQNKIEKLGVELKEGMEIQVFGYPEVRKDKGQFRFQAERIGLVGEGILKKQFEALKEKLEKEGVFALEIKKPIPQFCRRIGLITSKYGKGAKKDFETHLENYGFKVYFYDVRVEGLSAVDDICRAVKWFNENLLCDVLVLTRGGGNWESLRSFNSEETARAIFASKIPIIVGVGHEDDKTIADLAADFRASTPTHAAKVLSDNWKLASSNIQKLEKNFIHLTRGIFKNTEEKIIFFEKNLIGKIRKEVIFKKEKLNNLMIKLNLCFRNYFIKFQILEKEFKSNLFKFKKLAKDKESELKRQLKCLIKNQSWWNNKIKKLLKHQENKLILSSPTLKLKQGYTITLDNFGKIIKELADLKIGQTIKTKFYKGHSLSEIKKIKK